MDRSADELISYLSFFGRASFLQPNFRNPKEIDFAGVELITSEEIERDLLEELNSHLRESTGSPASLRAIEWATFRDNKFKYVIEIVPYGFVPINRYAEATARVLRDLPRLIKNYRMKKGKR